MTIRFWGVRGSLASPGEDTVGVGGNTSCVEVRCGRERFVFDAGTGIRGLGAAWAKEGPVDATLILSHLHWDHIQGLPFFGPLYAPSTRLRIVGAGTPELGVREALARQMRPPTFPVVWEDLASQHEYRAVRHGQRIRLGEGVELRAARLNHPGGGVTAYRLSWRGRSVVYATDTEHYACVDPVLRDLAAGCDVLIYDSQYTAAEYAGEVGPPRVGWGHSTWEAGVELARAAGVGRYVLFHHDPTRDDAGVAALEGLAQGAFPTSMAAREGMELELEAARSERAA
ncbi:MAG: MBL fold metallo-hydrolase [Sandaracinus sp.]|nr:MBL fold metallo-hydrolase [Sandaracinus sp.]